MRNRMILIALVFGLATCGSVRADYVDNVKNGNEAFADKDYMKALEQYHAAETDLPASPELEYNIAGALYGQGKYEEAVDKYTRALNSTDPALAAKAHYNLGNTYYRTQDYVKAIQSYEEALKINPKDMDAKFNLELARKMLKENSKPDQKNQQKQQNKKDQQNKQDQQNQDQNKDKQDQQNPDQSDQNQDQKDKQQQQKADPKNTKQMSKEDAERILNALRDNEQETQKRLKREIKVGEYNGKDW